MSNGKVILLVGAAALVYLLADLAVLLRGWLLLPADSLLRPLFLVAFTAAAGGFLGGRALQRVWVSRAASALMWLGAFWVAALLYLILYIIAVDLVLLADRALDFLPDWSARERMAAARGAAVLGVTLVGVIIVVGYINALTLRRRRVRVAIPKRAPGMRSLRVAVATDVHIGTIVGKNHAAALVRLINSLGPDLILLGGDVINEDMAPVLREDKGAALRGLKAPLGVYAVTGNHEHMGGVDGAVEYLESRGVRVLRDEMVDVNGSFYLVGREDHSSFFFDGVPRKPLSDIIAGIDPSRPLILLDHQPLDLSDGASAGADLQISGHTHCGQLWPLNYVTRAVHRYHCGLLRRGRMRILVSSGVGTWGPPIRVGNRPEVIDLRVRFR